MSKYSDISRSVEGVCHQLRRCLISVDSLISVVSLIVSVVSLISLISAVRFILYYEDDHNYH